MKSKLTLIALLAFALPAFAQTVVTNTNPDAVAVSMGNYTTKTMVSGIVQTSTADNISGIHLLPLRTVTANKTFYLQFLKLNAVQKNQTQYASVNDFGMVYLEGGAGVSLTSTHLVAPEKWGFAPVVSYEFAEPIPILAGTSIRLNINPVTQSSVEYNVNYGGYERN